MAVVAASAPARAAAAAPAAVRPQLPYADFFRALAIFYVFLAHAGGLVREPHLFHHIAFSDAVTLFDGVAMLFALSGFLLSAPLLRAYLDTPHTLPLVRPYLLARFLRIYPLYATAVLAIAAYLAATGAAPALRDIALHLAMLQDFSPDTIQSLSGPLWTMPLDAQFYLVLPLGFALLARGVRERDERARVNALVLALGLVVVASILYRFTVVSLWAPAGLDQQLFLVDQFPGMACLFALGIAARLTVMLIDRGALALKPNATTALAMIGVAIVARGLQYGAHGAWLHLAPHGGHFKPALFASVDEALGGIGCAVLLIAANYARTGWFGRLVASPVVAFAAAISYGFYLFHLTVLTSLDGRWHGSGARALPLLALIGLAILIPLCTLAHHAVEKPFLARKARLRRERVAETEPQAEYAGAERRCYAGPERRHAGLERDRARYTGPERRRYSGVERRRYAGGVLSQARGGFQPSGTPSS